MSQAPKSWDDVNGTVHLTERYGRRNIAKMYAEVRTLRNAIRAEGTPAIQAAWDAVEEHIDYAYRRHEPSKPVKSAYHTGFADGLRKGLSAKSEAVGTNEAQTGGV